MDKALFKSQMKYQLISWKTILITVISLLLILVEIKTTNDWRYLRSNNFLHYVLVFDRYSKAGGMYLLVLPLLSAMLGGTLYSLEKRSGRIKFLYARVAKPSMIKTTAVSSFLLGGIAALIPIILSLIVAIVYFPHFKFISPLTSQFPIFSQDFLGYKLFAHSQMLTIIILLLILFVFGGLIAVLAMNVSFFVKTKYSEVLLPFVGSFVWYLIVSVLGFPEIGHIVFLDFPITEGFRHTIIYLVITYLILSIVNIVLISYEVKQDDLV